MAVANPDKQPARFLLTHNQVQLPGSSQPATFPSSFTIGKTPCPPLVDSDQLKRHLALLRVFYGLREKAESTGFPQVSPTPPESLRDRRWSFFVGYAVERFQTWVCSPDLENVHELLIPPVDVLMVWHSYRLNPAWYAEDVYRVPEMIRFSAKASNLFESLILEESPGYRLENPSETEVELWVRLTRTPFDAFEGVGSWLARQVTCPYCRMSASVDLLNEIGTGYLQNGFNTLCSACQKEYNREALGVLKFIRNATREDGSISSMMAGTVHTPLEPCDLSKAQKVKQSLIQNRTFAPDQRISQDTHEMRIGNACEWKLTNLASIIETRMFVLRVKAALIRMLTAYIDDRPFSVDLVGAVLRQASFVEKMHKLRWTEPNYFNSVEDMVALQHAIARYHAFLDLMTSPNSFFVPTLDIDLAWHTHQLLSAQYGAQTMKYVGRFIDHDDKVEEDSLVNSFDLTCKAWQSRFNIPYSLCGCPIPGESIGRKLANRVSQFIGHDKYEPSHLVPSNHTHLIAGTHPSDHNGVILFKNKATSDAKHQKREAKLVKQQHKDAAKRGLGEQDPSVDPFWGSPFLYPVPIYYTPLCSATGGVIHAGCAAFAGRSCDGGSYSGEGSCVGTGGSCGSDGNCGGGGGGLLQSACQMPPGP